MRSSTLARISTSRRVSIGPADIHLIRSFTSSDTTSTSRSLSILDMKGMSRRCLLSMRYLILDTCDTNRKYTYRWSERQQGHGEEQIALHDYVTCKSLSRIYVISTRDRLTYARPVFPRAQGANERCLEWRGQSKRRRRRRGRRRGCIQRQKRSSPTVRINDVSREHITERKERS